MSTQDHAFASSDFHSQGSDSLTSSMVIVPVLSLPQTLWMRVCSYLSFYTSDTRNTTETFVSDKAKCRAHSSSVKPFACTHPTTETASSSLIQIRIFDAECLKPFLEVIWTHTLTRHIGVFLGTKSLHRAIEAAASGPSTCTTWPPNNNLKQISTLLGLGTLRNGSRNRLHRKRHSTGLVVII